MRNEIFKQVRSLLEVCNGLDEKLQFTLEGDQSPISYLQFEIIFDSVCFEVNWFRKSQTGNIFLHFDSASPLSAKKANVFNFLSLFEEIETFNRDNGVPRSDSNVKKFVSLLACNNYPNRLVREWVDEFNDKKRNQVKPEVHKVSSEGTSKVVDVKVLRPLIGSVPADGHCLLHSVSKLEGIRIQKLRI